MAPALVWAVTVAINGRDYGVHRVNALNGAKAISLVLAQWNTAPAEVIAVTAHQVHPNG